MTLKRHDTFGEAGYVISMQQILFYVMVETALLAKVTTEIIFSVQDCAALYIYLFARPHQVDLTELKQENSVCIWLT